jgi:hypothetical protein
MPENSSGMAGITFSGRARFSFSSPSSPSFPQGISDAVSVSAVQFVVRCKMR